MAPVDVNKGRFSDDETARLVVELLRHLVVKRFTARPLDITEPGSTSGTEPTMAYCPPELRYRRPS